MATKRKRRRGSYKRGGVLYVPTPLGSELLAALETWRAETKHPVAELSRAQAIWVILMNALKPYLKRTIRTDSDSQDRTEMPPLKPMLRLV